MPFTQRTENQRLGQFAPLDERKLGLLDQAIEERKQPMTEERKVPKQRALSTRHLEILDQAIAERKEREVPVEIPERTLAGTLKDIAVTAGKGMVGLGEAAVGLADIPTFGRVGREMEEYLDYKPKETQEFLSSLYSPAQKAITQEVESAKGFRGKIKTMLKHPSTIGHAVLESTPQMLGGAGIARTIITKGLLKISPLLAGAIGEGLVSAGGAAEAIRQQTEDGLLTPKQTLLPAISGAGTALFGVVGGRIAKKMGIVDVDTFLAGSSNVTDVGVIKRIIGGGISEGMFEELPQSMQEQVWLNAALDKPLLEGVSDAAATGILVGAAMGAGFNIFTGKAIPPKDATPEETRSFKENQAEIERQWIEIEEEFRRTPEGRQELIEAEMPEAPEAPMTTISEETTAIAGMEPERAKRRIEAFGRIPERGEIIGEERVEPELVTPEGLPLELARREEQIQIALAKEPFERTAEDKLLLQELERIEGVIEPPPPSPMRAFGMRPRRVEPTPAELTAEVAREPVGVEKEPVKFMGMQKIGDKTFPLFEATTGELKGGQVDYDVARHEIVNVAEYEKAIKIEEVKEPVKEVAAEKVEKIEVKEPWKITKDEFEKTIIEKRFSEDIPKTERPILAVKVEGKIYTDERAKLHADIMETIPDEVDISGLESGWIIDDKFQYQIPKVHKELVKQAIERGDKVPAEVLAEYPDLAPVEPLPPKLPEAKPPEAVTEEIKAKVIPEVKPKVEKVPPEKKEYFITMPEGKQKIEGKPIKIKGFEKYDLFYSKKEDQFNISEMTTGLSLATDKTLKGAKQKAFDLLTERKGEIDKVLKEKPKVEDIEEIPTIKETKDRLIKNIKDEKGESALITDLSTLGADAIRRGHESFKAFSVQMESTLSEVWDKIKHLMQKAYDAAKVVIKSERGEIVLREPKIKKLTAAEKMLGLRKIVKKITPKALDLGVEFKTDAAQKVSSMYDKTDTELEILRKPSLKNIYQKVKRATVDVSGNIKKELLNKGGQIGKEAVIHHDLIRGASSKAEKITTGATDKIYKNLSKNEERLLNRIIQSRRTIAIEKYTKIRHPGGLGVKEHQDFLDSIPKDIFAKLNKQADLYFTEMREQLKSLKEAGMLSQQDYKTLLSKGDYSPRWFIQHIDPERTYTFRGKKISVPDSGIKSLDTGSEQMLENNSRLMLISTITRIQSRIFRNRANQALHKLAEQVPDNGLVSLAKIVKKTKEGKPIYQKAPGGYEKVSVMIDGKHREMLLPNEMAREWVESDPAMNAQMANIIGWVSGSKILKPMATGLNPEFALANLPRDIAHIWLTTEQYSPALPKALLQMGKDLKATFPDAAKRKGAWLDYVDEGGGMNFLTHQGRITKPGGKLDIIQKVLGYIGETSEIWTRLALRNRALREGKTSAEATWIARSYLDFSQGGWLAKGADTAIPYLNAGIQGTRGIIRAAVANPKVFMQKTAQIGGLSIALFLANKFINPDALDEIPEREKVNNFIITTPLSYRDKNGDMRYLYFKIAKDQGQRIVATIFETLTAKYMGEDIDSVQIAQAIQDFIPLMPDQATPPTWDAMMGYLANVDFWRREDIWKGPRVTPKEEFTTYTHPSFVEFGKATGLSPEKTRYALQQYFTYGNIYTSAVGAGFKLMTNQLDKDSKEKVTQEILKDMPFARRVLKATQPYTKYEKRIEEVKIEESTRRYKQNREIDKLSEQFHKKIITKDKINEFVKKQPKEDQTRLKSRFKRYGQIYNIPDRRWWLNISGMPPETRAVMFWNRYRDANKEEKERLSKYLKKVPGVTSKRFYAKLRRLQKELVVGQPAITIPGMVPWKTKKRPAWQKSMFGKKPAWQKGIEF